MNLQMVVVSEKENRIFSRTFAFFSNLIFLSEHLAFFFQRASGVAFFFPLIQKFTIKTCKKRVIFICVGSIIICFSL